MVVRRNAIAGRDPNAPLLGLLSSVDVAFTNLEVVPIDYGGYPRAGLRGTHLNAPSGVIDDLSSAGFNLFSCANNHALNFGIEGLVQLIGQLKARSVDYAGIGLNLAESRLPAYVDSVEGRCALLSCTSTFREGEEAGAQKEDYLGRPGVNPLRLRTTYHVNESQWDSLRGLACELGMGRRLELAIARGMRREITDDGTLVFLENVFKRSDSTRMSTSYFEKDYNDMARWIREARRRADVVVMSIHSHEQGESEDKPPEFLVDFARRAVDAGCDVVVVHGPHYLRGMELYRERPIFYSLGNFISQAEYVQRLPWDAYEYLDAPVECTPADLFEMRSDGGRRGFNADGKYWESVIPVCEFKSGSLESLELYPLSLGYALESPRKGSPYLAEGAEARKILSLYSEMSECFGVEIDVRNDVGRVKLRSY